MVFDLDGTVVAGDSFGAFLRHLIVRHRARHVVALATVPLWLPALLACPLCAAAGLDGVEVVASTLVRRRWGPPRRVVSARGAGKLRALEAVGVVPPVDHASSDSVTDLPLLRAARTAHLVDPTARDLARLRAALGEDVEVLLWAVR